MQGELQISLLVSLSAVLLRKELMSFRQLLHVAICKKLANSGVNNMFQVVYIVQRFKKRASEEVEDTLEDDWSESAEEASEGEEEYSSAKPIYAFWAEKGLIKPQNMRNARKGQAAGLQANAGRKRRLQVGASHESFAISFSLYIISSDFKLDFHELYRGTWSATDQFDPWLLNLHIQKLMSLKFPDTEKSRSRHAVISKPVNIQQR